MKKITLRTEQQISLGELASQLVHDDFNIDQDTIFELIKHLELEIADVDFCKRLADYFTEEYKECIDECEKKNAG